MIRFLFAVAGMLGRLLGVARPLAVPSVALPPLVPCVPGLGQVANVPALPGRYTPSTGGEP